jgi:hypothetical protein
VRESYWLGSDGVRMKRTRLLVGMTVFWLGLALLMDGLNSIVLPIHVSFVGSGRQRQPRPADRLLVAWQSSHGWRWSTDARDAPPGGIARAVRHPGWALHLGWAEPGQPFVASGDPACLHGRAPWPGSSRFAAVRPPGAGPMRMRCRPDWRFVVLGSFLAAAVLRWHRRGPDRSFPAHCAAAW